ncbi:hypothetical protein AVANS_0899 [Campylobacter sp. RM5004]|uniref:hypothetical protein n=1 Tax=Campylobacter sp. RM5004 TaxID=1660078 RepID=UPI001EFAB96D|nr:hypothetical protein [Campylobacter sp. RM5004]ULO01527.1 hypothetical protein AVANS_0899 [Campylobacter sp. RM5004]
MLSFIKELIKKSLFVGLCVAFSVLALVGIPILIMILNDFYSKYFNSTYDKFLKTKEELYSLERQLEVEGYTSFWDFKNEYTNYKYDYSKSGYKCNLEKKEKYKRAIANYFKLSNAKIYEVQNHNSIDEVKSLKTLDILELKEVNEFNNNLVFFYDEFFDKNSFQFIDGYKMHVISYNSYTKEKEEREYYIDGCGYVVPTYKL